MLGLPPNVEFSSGPNRQPQDLMRGSFWPGSQAAVPAGAYSAASPSASSSSGATKRGRPRKQTPTKKAPAKKRSKHAVVDDSITSLDDTFSNEVLAEELEAFLNPSIESLSCEDRKQLGWHPALGDILVEV